jgi:hypothetical protein
MKLPEPLFAIINPVVKLLLKSPLHFLSSRSLMLITFTGRKSGREFTTPVRYVRTEETVRCFTSSENQWWRNLRGGADVVLRTEGQNAPYHAVVIENNPEEVKKQLQHYLALFPQDAAYHDIRLNNDKSLVTADLEAAARNAIVVEAHPIHQGV